jgi:serine/threonine protein kinase
MPSSSQAPVEASTVRIAHRMLRVLLVVGFILEVDSALSAYARANTLERFMDRMQSLGATLGSSEGPHELPSTSRLFIWACLAVALFCWGSLRGGFQGLREAWEVERPWVGQVRDVWWPVAMGSLGGEVLFSAFDLVVRPGLSALGAMVSCGLSLGLAVTFFLAVVLLEQEPAAPAALPERPAKPSTPATLAARASPRAPVPAAAAPAAPVPALAPGLCAVCAQPAQGPRCTACGAAVLAGGFRVVGVLAQSAHARTYLTLAPDGTKAVLKEMSFALMPDESTLVAFEREGQLLEQLRHARVPRFLTRFTEGQGAGQRFYLAYAYVEGVSLAEELGRRRYTEAQAVELTRSVLRVLAYLHALSPPVVHRDLKPANLLRQPDGSLVLVDFGSARELSRTTHQATMVGTVGYMPREQLAGQVDVTSDLYALGTTVLHLLTRRAPWELLDETGRLVFPRQLQVSPTFRRFLQQLTAPRRKERFASAREALRALDTPTAGPQLPLWVLGAGAATVLLLIVGGALGSAWIRMHAKAALADTAAPRPAPAPVQPPPAAPAPLAEPEPERTPALESEWEPASSPVVASFDGGEVSEDELRERTARLPPRLRGKDSAVVREMRAEVLVKEKLLAREAERTVALKPAWSALPEALQRRHRLRALVDAQVPAQTPPDALPLARMRVILELGRTLAQAARMHLDKDRLFNLAPVEHAPHWRAWELRAAHAAQNEPRREILFQHDESLERCEGSLNPSAASYDARCGCEALPDQFFDDDVLYFDLYLSGEGPNVLFTHNFTGSSCRQIHLSSGAPASVEEKMARQTAFFLSLTPQVLRAPADARHESLDRLLNPVRIRFGECLNRRAREDYFEGSLILRWSTVSGEVRDLSVAPSMSRGTADLEGTAVEHCLRTILESWRLVTLPPGAYAVRFLVDARREPTDLDMR